LELLPAKEAPAPSEKPIATGKEEPASKVGG